MARIGIGNRFFAQVKADYSCWQQALIREALQNCIDSGAKKIEFSVFRDGDNTVLIFENNGVPMTREVLETKLLNLGETGKGFGDGAVGGFGRAKELLYFTHLGYKISSGSLQVEGSGGEYEVTIADPGEYLEGTWSRVVVEGDEVDELRRQVHLLISLLQWRGEVSLDGDVLTRRLNKGRSRVKHEWAHISTSKEGSSIVVVRIGGIPMFVLPTSYPGVVVVELVGNSDKVLTSNRDGLQWTYRYKLDAFLNDLVVDRRSALREKPSVTWYRYAGTRLGYHEIAANTAVQEALGDALKLLEASAQTSEAKVAEEGPQIWPEDSELNVQAPVSSTQVGYSKVSHEFIIKSELTRKIPKSWQGLWLSTKAQWLIRVWARCLVEIHNLFKTEGAFGVGFVFESENQHDSDNQVLALYEEHSKLGHVYLINPVKWVRTKDSKLRLAPRWSKQDRYKLLAIACHEYVHFLGYRRHDEDYAAKLTEVMGRVFGESKRFSKLFK